MFAPCLGRIRYGLGTNFVPAKGSPVNALVAPVPCMLSTAQGRTRYHQYVVGAETGCQAVTWNRNASDLFAGKWLRARDLNPRPDTERDAANG